MAKNCSLCGKSLNFFNSTKIAFRNIPVCFDCYDFFNDVHYHAKNIINFDSRIKQFKERYGNSGAASDIIDYLESIYERAKKEDPVKAEKEIRRIEQEQENACFEKERIRIEKEDAINRYSYIGPFTDKPYVYSIDGVRGRHIDIYNDKVVITTNVTLGSILAHNATDGEKTIYFSDCIGVQYKKSSFTIGYLQFETASSGGNNAASNFFHENSFTFDLSVVSNEKMEEVVAFVKGRIDEVKRAANAPVQTVTVAAPVAPNFIADELLKLKQLVDMGVLTQEEFDQQKKKILGQ